jgi:hypothetical protein
MLNGCGSSTTAVQSAAGGIWSAELLGGEAGASGFSFITQFTLSGSNISITSFQFDNAGSCFPVSGGTQSGTLSVTYNSAGVVSGTFSFTVSSGGNTLTLTSSAVTGNFNTTTNTLSDGSITGSWTFQGATTACPATSGSFTMTQTTS